MAAAVLGESSYRPSNFVTRLHRPSNPTIDSVSTSTTTPPLLAAAKYADEALRRQVNELCTSLSANTKLPPDRPFVVRDISLQTWRSFKATYARCQMFSDRKLVCLFQFPSYIADVWCYSGLNMNRPPKRLFHYCRRHFTTLPRPLCPSMS